MTDLQEARRFVADMKLWGRVPERAILGGYWDGGSLIQEALQDLLKHRPEASDDE